MANGKAGAPKGNTNGSKKNKLVTDALRLVVTQNPKQLKKMCEKLLEDAEAGNIAAAREIFDRLDGKAAQIIEGSGSNGEITIRITADDSLVL